MSMYKEKCLNCGIIFCTDAGDYCPNCGSGDTEEFHLRECNCEQCKKYLESEDKENQLKMLKTKGKYKK